MKVMSGLLSSRYWSKVRQSSLHLRIISSPGKWTSWNHCIALRRLASFIGWPRLSRSLCAGTPSISSDGLQGNDNIIMPDRSALNAVITPRMPYSILHLAQECLQITCHASMRCVWTVYSASPAHLCYSAVAAAEIVLHPRQKRHRQCAGA